MGLSQKLISVRSRDLRMKKLASRKKAQRTVSLAGKSCAMCGKTTSLNRHHHDYTKATDVEIVCRSCHMDEHREEFSRVGVLSAMKRWGNLNRDRICKNCGDQFRYVRARQTTCGRSCGNTLAWKARKGIK